MVCASSVERPVPPHGPGLEIFRIFPYPRPTVTRDPLPELYRDVGDAYKTLSSYRIYEEDGKRVKNLRLAPGAASYVVNVK